jgi:hypothetical protein
MNSNKPLLGDVESNSDNVDDGDDGGAKNDSNSALLKACFPGIVDPSHKELSLEKASQETHKDKGVWM